MAQPRVRTSLPPRLFFVEKKKQRGLAFAAPPIPPRLSQGSIFQFFMFGVLYIFFSYFRFSRLPKLRMMRICWFWRAGRGKGVTNLSSHHLLLLQPPHRCSYCALCNRPQFSKHPHIGKGHKIFRA